MAISETVYLNASDFKAVLVEDINNASKSVDIENYMLKVDSLGGDVLAALNSASARGVKVRIITDGFGSREWVSAIAWDKSIHPDIDVRVFHPIPFYAGDHLSVFHLKKVVAFLSRINMRNHKKLVIIDSTIAHLGSVNLYEDSFNQREISVRFNYAIKTLSNYFNYTWAKSEFSLRKEIKQRISFKFRYRVGPVLCRYDVFSGRKNRRVLNLLLKRVQKRIWIMTPYFVPPITMLKRLADAAERGVDVRLILPENCDVRPVKFVSGYYYQYLLEKNVKIFEHGPKVLHAKAAIIDEMAVVGSSNFDYRSLFTNLEVDLILQTESSFKTIEGQFIDDFDTLREVSPDFIKKQGWIKTVLCYFLLLFKGWL